MTVPVGTFDTYRVVCKDKWTRYDYYFAPALGTVVLSAQSPIGLSGTTPYRKELAKFEPVG